MDLSRPSRTWRFSDIHLPAIDALREGKFRAWEQSDNSGSIAVPPRDPMWNTASKRAERLPAEGPRPVRQAMALPVRPPEVLYGSLPIRHVNTCQLRRFVLMMQFRSASAAERHSGIKAAGVLYAVRCIEDRLSTKLFERNGTTMRPTAAAHRLYPCAIRLLEMWDELIAELRPPPDSALAAADTATGDASAESDLLPTSALPPRAPNPRLAHPRRAPFANRFHCFHRVHRPCWRRQTQTQSQAPGQIPIQPPNQTARQTGRAHPFGRRLGAVPDSFPRHCQDRLGHAPTCAAYRLDRPAAGQIVDRYRRRRRMATA